MTTSIKITDKTLFGNEAGEDENEIIFASYAIQRDEYTQFIDENNQIAIARAYKGEGKSALLRQVALHLKTINPQPIIISTNAPSISPEINDTDTDKWVRGWKINLLKQIASEVGANISLAFSDDAISLVEEAEANGFKSRNFVSAIADRLQTSAVPLKRTRPQITNPEKILSRWISEGSSVWFIIDDIDQNFENVATFRVKIASFFIAIRQISNKIPDIRFRAAIRPNVWAIVKRDHEALSHVEQYIIDMRWQLMDFHKLIAKRIQGYLERNNYWDEVKKELPTSPRLRERELIKLVFEDPMPFGNDPSRPPTTTLYTFARHRPRWLIELWRESAKEASSNRSQQITLSHLNAILPSFGNRRISDSIAEFRSACPQIEDLIVAFHNKPERMTTDDLISIITNDILQKVNPRLHGSVGVPSPYEIAHFLFQIGFITARKDLPNGKYDHVSYAENPSLLKSRVNIDQGHNWEIHPVFRHALNLKNY